MLMESRRNTGESSVPADASHELYEESMPKVEDGVGTFHTHAHTDAHVYAHIAMVLLAFVPKQTTC